MDRNIKAIVFGAGAMGRVGIKAMADHGIEIVGAVGRKRNIGKDIGELAGIGPIGVPLENDVKNVLAKTSADIAVISTESGLAQLEPLVRTCADHHMDIITIGEDAIYPWHAELEMAGRLDSYLKEKGVTLYGTGTFDVFWANIPQALAAGCNKIDAMKFHCILGLEDMGPVVAEELFVGRSPEEYKSLTARKPAEENGLARCSMTYNYANADILGLHPDQEVITMEPVVAEKDTEFPQWSLKVKKGSLLGLNIFAKLTTEEHITLEYTSYFKAFVPGEEFYRKNHIDYLIEGDPSLHMILENMKGEVTTAYSQINRIPDVLNASPGFKTVVDMPRASYRSQPMHKYVL